MNLIEARRAMSYQESVNAVQELADLFGKIDAVCLVNKSNVFQTFSTENGSTWMVEAVRRAIVQRIASRAESLAEQRMNGVAA